MRYKEFADAQRLIDIKKRNAARNKRWTNEGVTNACLIEMNRLKDVYNAFVESWEGRGTPEDWDQDWIKRQDYEKEKKKLWDEWQTKRSECLKDVDPPVPPGPGDDGGGFDMKRIPQKWWEQFKKKNTPYNGPGQLGPEGRFSFGQFMMDAAISLVELSVFEVFIYEESLQICAYYLKRAMCKDNKTDTIIQLHNNYSWVLNMTTTAYFQRWPFLLYTKPGYQDYLNAAWLLKLAATLYLGERPFTFYIE